MRKIYYSPPITKDRQTFNPTDLPSSLWNGENYNQLLPWNTVANKEWVQGNVPPPQICTMVDHIPYTAAEEPFIPEFVFKWFPYGVDEESELFPDPVIASFSEPFDPTQATQLTIENYLGCYGLTEPALNGENPITAYLYPQEFYEPIFGFDGFPFIVWPTFMYEGTNGWTEYADGDLLVSPTFGRTQSAYADGIQSTWWAGPTNIVLETPGAVLAGLITTAEAGENVRPFTYKITPAEGYVLNRETGEISQIPIDSKTAITSKSTFLGSLAKHSLAFNNVEEYNKNIDGNSIAIYTLNLTDSDVPNGYTIGSNIPYLFKLINGDLVAQELAILYICPPYTPYPEILTLHPGEKIPSELGFIEGVKNSLYGTEYVSILQVMLYTPVSNNQLTWRYGNLQIEENHLSIKIWTGT